MITLEIPISEPHLVRIDIYIHRIEQGVVVMFEVCVSAGRLKSMTVLKGKEKRGFVHEKI